MMHRKHLTRRRFMRIFALPSVFGFVPIPRALAALFDSPQPDILISGLTKIIVRKKSAEIVGRAYLESHPEEADAPLLADLIRCSLDEPLPNLIGLEPEQLRKLVQSLQKEDFKNGRTAKVRGWVLSKTEARLCALVALS